YRARETAHRFLHDVLCGFAGRLKKLVGRVETSQDDRHPLAAAFAAHELVREKFQSSIAAQRAGGGVSQRLRRELGARHLELILELEHALSRAQPHSQVEWAAGLDQIVVRPGIQPPSDVLFVVARREQNDVKLRLGAPYAYRAANLDAVEPGHDPIEHGAANL